MSADLGRDVVTQRGKTPPSDPRAGHVLGGARRITAGVTARIVKPGPILSGNVPVTWRRYVTSPPRGPIAVQVAALALLAALTAVHGWWAAQVLLVPLLLVVPGVILLRALRVPGRVVASFPVYIPCASLIVLMGSGIAVDLVGPLIGVTAPLRALPLLVGLEAICAVLLAYSVNAPPEVEISWGSLSRPGRLAWPLVLPLVAAVGALRLNSGHGNSVALIAAVASVVLLVSTFWYAPRLGHARLAVIAYAAGLALMWSFSLRSQLVYGFDIAAEYYSMHQAVITGIWHAAHRGDAYGAMLSVTVLPAELHALSGLPDLLVFTVVYPAIAALFPVAIFGLARRVLTPRWAFAAAAFVVMQNTFFQQLPGLAREEIATVLFAALIAAVLERRVPRRPQWALVGLLSLGMVVSHYSTTYMAITMLAFAAALQWGISWFRLIPRVTGPVLVALAIALAGAFLWYGPVTRSASNLSQFLATAEGQGINLLPNHGTNLMLTYLQGESSQELTPAQYQRSVHEYYESRYPFVVPLPDAGEPQYALRAAPVSEPPVTWTLGYNALSQVSLVVQQLSNLLAGIGVLLILLRRNVPVIARQVGLLGLAALLILALTRVSGTIAQAYNPERALLQAMIVLAIALCWPLQGLAARWKRHQPAMHAVVAFCLAAFLVGSVGLAGAAFGGGMATNLASSGADYQEYYMTAEEIASAEWLSQAAPRRQLVYADRYGELRLEAAAGVRSGTFDDITPLTLDQHAWVYASQTNVVDGTARSVFGNEAATYAFPTRFLELDYDTVYTDGASEVFHR
jgi:uncharacterized membrane protein